MWLVAALAHASALAGFGVPVTGGGLVAGWEQGPAGVVVNPAAAWAPDAELLLDVGAMQTTYHFRLEGEREQPATGTSPVPFLAGTVPVGPVGVGLGVFAPYARGGAGSDPEGPQRYHSVVGNLLVAEADLAVATHLEFGRDRPLFDVEVGGALRGARMTMRSERSFDTGALLYGMLGPEAGVPLQDPLLEGTLALEGLRGTTFGAATGLRVTVAERVTLAFGYRSSLRMRLRGPVTLVPSKDLQMVVEGDVRTELVLPAEGTLSTRVDLGRGALLGEVALLGWSSMRQIRSGIDELTISSPDPLMQGILEGYGLDEAEFLGSLGEMVTTTGMQDVWVVGAGGEVQPGGGWTLRGYLQHAGAAVPLPNVHPGNVDWATWDVRGVARWDLGPRVSLALSGDLLLAPSRRVEDSPYALTNDPATGMVFPSADGEYAFAGGRAGLTLLYRPVAVVD